MMEVLEKLAMKLGYEKGEKLEFLNKRIVGLWLIWIGVVIIIATIVGGEFLVHPVVFGGGYFTGFLFILRNKYLRKKLSFGPLSKFQSKVGNLSIVLLFVLIISICRSVGDIPPIKTLPYQNRLLAQQSLLLFFSLLCWLYRCEHKRISLPRHVCNQYKLCASWLLRLP